MEIIDYLDRIYCCLLIIISFSGIRLFYKLIYIMFRRYWGDD